MRLNKRQLKRIIREEKRKLLKESFTGIGRSAPSPMKSRADAEFAAAIKGKLNENVPSAIGMEILAIKDALVELAVGIGYHDEELANDLQLQIERLRSLGYKA